MKVGHGQRRAVLILWGWTALLSGFVLYPAFTRTGQAYAPIGLLAIALALYTVLHPRLRARRDANARDPRGRDANDMTKLPGSSGAP